jgi:hypothetical protein
MSAFKNLCVIILIVRCDWQWNGGWPIDLTSHSPRKEIEFPALDTDQPHIQNLRGRTYMAAVSPWFFTVRDQSIRSNPETDSASFSFALSALWAKIMEQECTSVPCLYSHRTAVYSLQWIYRGDDWLLVRRWEYLLAQRSAIDIVQVISWNGEFSLVKLPGFHNNNRPCVRLRRVALLGTCARRTAQLTSLGRRVPSCTMASAQCILCTRLQSRVHATD